MLIKAMLTHKRSVPPYNSLSYATALQRPSTIAAFCPYVATVGFSNVKNPKAHHTPASIWRVNE